MAVNAGDIEDTRQNKNVVSAGAESAMTGSSPRESTPARHDYARELTEVINREFVRRGRSEAVIVSGIRQRVELYEKAFVQAKQDAIEVVARSAAPAERHARQDETLRKADVEVLPPEMIGKLAALDARYYGKLHDPQRRAEAALAMAEMARRSVAYRAALAAKAPEVSAAVGTAMGTSEKPTEISVASAPGDRPAVRRDEKANEALRGPTMALDPGTLERVATKRVRGVETVTKQLGLNGIEKATEQQPVRRDAHVEEQRTAFNSAEGSQPKARPARAAGNNQVTSDEVFTASKDEAKPILPVEVEEKYLRVGSKFYHPKNTNTAAFEDKGNKLQTHSNSEQITEVMVAIARARGWDEIKVSGSETFRREVWLEGSAHGMRVKGYRPSAVDEAELAKRSRHVEASQVDPQLRRGGRDGQSEAPQMSKVEQSKAERMKMAEMGEASSGWRPATEAQKRAKAFAGQSTAEAIADHPELAGTYAAVASMKKKTAADRLSPQQRAVVMARIEANVVNSIERGELPAVKVREQVAMRRELDDDREITR
jgi:hypothetical protein